MSDSARRWAYAAWLLLVLAFAAVHFVHLTADFPNHSPWISDWAKYTDEGWYGNAAIRAHLFGHWRIPRDFNPAAALPVWPLLEWLLFFATGVSITAARALSVSFFCFDLALGYLLVRANAPRWAALIAVTLAVTSPFLYAFSRLAILEPALIAFTLIALNLAVRVVRTPRPVLAAAVVGLLFSIMVLTKTSAVFLLPSVSWALLAPLWRNRTLAIRCALAASASAALTLITWMAVVVFAHLLPDFKYLFLINKYPKPHHWYWPALSFWACIRDALWGGRVLIPLAVAVTFAAFVLFRARSSRALRDTPAFGASVLAALGYLLFMAYQDNPQPRYYTVIALFACLIVGLGVHALFVAAGEPRGLRSSKLLGVALTTAAAFAVAGNAALTLSYVTHPEYTFVGAARSLTRYIDLHPNGSRILLATSGDQITLMTHVPSLCDEFGTEPLPAKIARYQPGWWATWNDIDPAILAALHIHNSVEQVATFRALDHRERNVLVLFKLHPLPNGQARDGKKQDLKIPLSDDKIDIPIQ